MSLLRALNTTVGKKFVMAITGLLLCGFLVTHLAGNVLMFAGAEAYDTYAHTLHSQEALLMVAETGLAVLFLAHIYLAITTTMENTAARRHGYADKESKIDSGFRADTWMFWSGVVVLGFLIWHMIDFKLEARETIAPIPGFEYAEHGPFAKAIRLLSNPITAGVYVVGVLFLGFHLSHGFRSAFQSLGINHPAWNRAIQWLGILFAIVVAIGFASFPVLVISGVLR